MDGAEEGVFAWITVNYLTKALTTSAATAGHTTVPPMTSAILDLGGASTQIVFEPSTATLTDLPSALHGELYSLPYGARTYRLFETSYLGYGLMEARRRVKQNLLAHPRLQVHTPTPGAGDSAKMLHPCLSDAHEEEVAAEDASASGSKKTVMRGLAQGHASCAAVVRTLFPKAACPTSPHCSFGGHFSLPLADHAALSTAEVAHSLAGLGKIYAFSYFYDRTLEIFELEEEEPEHSAHASPDGTVLKLERIRHLADTVCSYSGRENRVRELEEVEQEKAAELAERIEAQQQRGCTIVHVQGPDGRTREVRKQDSSPEAAANEQDTAECMVEEKPVSSSSKHSRISSPLASLVRSNPHLCLDLTYAHTLLHFGYDLPEATELHVMKRLQSKEVGWCLGAMLSQMAQQGW
jgi:Golgi nucleoside diphosphatase